MQVMATREQAPQPLLEDAVPDFDKHSVSLAWTNGAKTVAYFEHVVGKGIFEDFSDPKVFNEVKVTEGGYFLSWPNGIEYAAMTLWEIAMSSKDVPRPVRSEFTPKSNLVLGG